MGMDRSGRAKTLALQLLVHYDRHISAASLWKSVKQRFPIHRHLGDKPFSALHCICYFGIPELINTLIKMKIWDLNQRDGLCVTPLICAARCGREEVARLLLRKKPIQPDVGDEIYGPTALSWAAGNGHEAVVRLFLGLQFVNPGRVGRLRGKAAQVVGLLFGGKYVNPDSSN